jgi:hypothetical protein
MADSARGLKTGLQPFSNHGGELTTSLDFLWLFANKPLQSNNAKCAFLKAFFPGQ